MAPEPDQGSSLELHRVLRELAAVLPSSPHPRPSPTPSPHAERGLRGEVIQSQETKSVPNDKLLASFVAVADFRTTSSQ